MRWLAACWLLLGAPRVAAAGPSLSWTAPDECPSEEVFRQRIAAALQQPLEGFEQGTTFECSVARDGNEYRLVLVSRRGQERGERVLVDDDCDALTGAAAVAVALAVQSGAGEEPQPDPEKAFEPPLPKEPPGRARHPRVGLLAVAQVDAGSLPAPSAGLALGFSVGGARFQTGLRAGSLGPVRDVVDHRGGVFWLWGGQVDACVRPIARRTSSVMTCALLELAELSGRGKGVDHPRRGSAISTAPGGRLTAGLRLGGSPVFALVGVSMLGPVGRRWFILDGNERLHRSQAVVGRLEVGVEAEIW